MNRTRPPLWFWPLAAGVAALALVSCALFMSRPDTRKPSGAPDGAKVYNVYCSGCHGADGRRMAGSADLSRTASKADSVLRAALEHGRPGSPPQPPMPPMKQPRGPLTEQEVAAVLGFLRERLAPPSTE